MSEADKLFEELGYKKYINDLGNIEFYKYQTVLCENDDIQIIRFYNNSKDFWSNHLVTMQELQAINKKCEELGWV